MSFNRLELSSVKKDIKVPYIVYCPKVPIVQPIAHSYDRYSTFCYVVEYTDYI